MGPDSQSATRTGEIVDRYRRFRARADSVEPDWQKFFRDLDSEARTVLESLASPGPTSATDADGTPSQGALDSIRAMALVNAYRTRGHLEANLDPLSLADPESHPDLDPGTYGFAESDLDRPICVDRILGLEFATLRELIASLRRSYCGVIGVEYTHIQEPEQVAWIRQRFEGGWQRFALKPEGKRAILERLADAECFERFLHRKYVGTKRFGLDGAESVIPGLEQILRRSSELGIEEIVIGMPHRGRLNVLANVMEKPPEAIFSEFAGVDPNPDDYGSGDVKYHLGTATDREIAGRPLHLSLTANPSHLEAVDPVVIGKVRAKQDLLGDHDDTRVLPLLMHGDAAFAGQGLVPETLDLAEITGYDVGGTIHLIVNNRIGFTTNPASARTGPYCSDIAKFIGAPIFHVNGDFPEEVVTVATLAAEFRRAFNKDVIIDVFCYRRFGHNEGDEPAFTQPLMYRRIAEQPSILDLYANRLVEQGAVSREDVDALVSACNARLESAFEASKTYAMNQKDWLEGAWSGLEPVRGYDARRGKTAVDIDTLKEVGFSMVTAPEDFHVHPKIERQLVTKRKAIESGEGIDWATAEALALGSLLIEGHPVRLSGQDSQRGTFSQRHAVLIDQVDERPHVLMNHAREHQAKLEVLNSPLAELSVLGFEYGYSLADPRTLVIWEAQFGDFVNGAQIIIDQFITAAEFKWLRMSGLVMLLPHGYEGQGPEHSSARLERFLLMCAEDNIQVVNCTTPANYFHVLRRQMHRSFRKPLVVMAPKSLLRHKQVVSSLADMGPGTSFHRVMYDDRLPSDVEEARQVVLCSGKVYYDLLDAREAKGANDVHFFRLEQLYPFPAEPLVELLAPYKECHLVWCQEEPRNMGAWPLVEGMLREVAAEIGCTHPEPRYAGRHSSASTATGSFKRHRKEQAALLEDALTVGKQGLKRVASGKARKRGTGGRK